MDISKGGKVCVHIFDGEKVAFCRQFTGKGTAYNLICEECGRNFPAQHPPLRAVSAQKFGEIDADSEVIVGEPEILERELGLGFVDEKIEFQPSIASAILDIQPFGDQWLVVNADGALRKIDVTHRTQREIMRFSSDDLQLSDEVALQISVNQRFAIVVNQRGQHGIVLDLQKREVCLSLDRGDYHTEQTLFPVEFVQHQDRTLLVHGTSWNRLDIHELPSGSLLTSREPTHYMQGKPRPEHYLDYFHGRLVVSPDDEWIAEDGWVWHPIGINRVWSLRRWLNVNVWESEDGETMKDLTFRGYHWNSPLCWISNSHLAIWGFGIDDDWMIPAVQIFDVTTGHLQRWFAGPKKGILFFDVHLFSSSDEGTEVWDIQTGERLLSDPKTIVTAYSPHTKQFIRQIDRNHVILSRLVNP